MRITTILKAATVALAVLAFAAPTVAQEDPGSRRGSNGDPIIADLDFGGGSLEAFVRALRKAAGDSPVNIVYGPEAAGIPIPPIDLQHVDAFMALRSVSHASHSLVERDPEFAPITWLVDRISGDGTPVYTIQVREVSRGRASGPGSPPAAQLHTAVHAITNLTSGSDGMPADDVLAAIQLALEMDGTSDAKLSFHEETGLLFARVSQAQANAIEMTIMHLERSLQARRTREQQAPIDSLLDHTGADDVDELLSKLREIDALREAHQEMRRYISKLETRIADLQADLAAARRQ